MTQLIGWIKIGLIQPYKLISPASFQINPKICFLFFFFSYSVLRELFNNVPGDPFCDKVQSRKVNRLLYLGSKFAIALCTWVRVNNCLRTAIPIAPQSQYFLSYCTAAFIITFVLCLLVYILIHMFIIFVAFY